MEGAKHIVRCEVNVSYYLEIVREKWKLRKLVTACSNAISRAYEPDGEASSIAAGVDSALVQITAERQGSDIRSTAELVRAAIPSWESQKAGTAGGLMTGFPDLDKMTQGLKPGELVILAARPSIGKTALAMNIAANIASDGHPVGVISLEMSGQSLAKRMMTARAGIQTKRPQDWRDEDCRRITNAAGWMSKLPIHIDDTPGVTVCQLRARVRGMKRRNAIELLVVDYLQLLASETKRGENREREVAMFSNAIKTLARELEIPILLLCQLNRDLERDKTRKPRLSDLRESGSIEQDADLVGMLYRVPAETEDDNPTAPQPVNLLIAKNRDGEQGEVRLTLLREFTRFESVRPIHE